MTKSLNKKLREMGILSGDGTCGAKTRGGTPCRRWALEGSVRCRLHGGASPQVLAKAKERLLLVQDDAVSVLIQIMFDPKVSASDRRQAAATLLDRGGLRPGAELTVEIAPWIGVLEGVVADVPEGAVLTRTHDYSARQEALDAINGQMAGSPKTITVGADGQVTTVRPEPATPDPNADEPWVDGRVVEMKGRTRIRTAHVTRD